MRMFFLLLGLPAFFFLMIGAGCGILHRHQGEWRPDQLSRNCFYSFCEVASTSGFYSIRSAPINPDQFSGFSLNLKTSNALADFAGLGWCPVWLHDRTLFAEVPLAANEVEMRVVFCKHCFVWCCCKSFFDLVPVLCPQDSAVPAVPATSSWRGLATSSMKLPLCFDIAMR